MTATKSILHGRVTAFLVCAVALLVLPVALQPLGEAWVRILDTALLYILLALGLNIVVGFAGLLDLGYIAFYAVGSYLFALLASPHLLAHFPAVAAAFPDGLHMPVWAVIPLGAGVAALVGVLLGVIESMGAGYIGELTGGVLGSHYQDIFAFTVLILVLTLRPQGLLGERVADRA